MKLYWVLYGLRVNGGVLIPANRGFGLPKKKAQALLIKTVKRFPRGLLKIEMREIDHI